MFEKGDLVECLDVRIFEFSFSKTLGVVKSLREDSFGETIYDVSLKLRFDKLKLILPFYISSLRLPTAEQFFYEESGVEILISLLKE